jgi:hypothetical protein
MTPLVAACTSSPTPPGRPDPDVALRQAAIAAELSLLAMYDAALASARPIRAVVLQAVRNDHVEHLRALRGPATTASPSPGQPATAPTLAQLVEAERASGLAHATSALTASPTLAALLASVAASEASHPVALA